MPAVFKRVEFTLELRGDEVGERAAMGILSPSNTCPKKATASSVTSSFTWLLSRPVVGTLSGVTVNPVSEKTSERMSLGFVNVSILQKSIATPEEGKVTIVRNVLRSRIARGLAAAMAPELCVCAHNPESK